MNDNLHWIVLVIVALLLLGKVYKDKEVVKYTAIVDYVAFSVGSYVIIYSLMIMIIWFIDIR